MNHVVSQPTAPFVTSSGKLEVHQVLAWQDNLIWLLVDRTTREAAAIDGPEASGVLKYCEQHGLRLTTIINTHTHGDHIGINRDLMEKGLLEDMRVVGAKLKQSEVPGVTETVSDSDIVRFGPCEGRAMLTEGHIDGHISYHFDDVLFCGDTMFGAGCGYLFDGPPAKMQASLARLAELPPETRVCCAHEYTQDNLTFAWSIDYDNESLKDRIIDTWALRARGECSIPSTIALERATNPFLRGNSKTIRAELGKQGAAVSISTPVEVFAATRALKDSKVYRDRLPRPLPA